MEELTIAQAHEAFKNSNEDGSSLTSRKLTEYYMQRIKQFDVGIINSISAISNNALAEAEALDAYFARTNTLIGPLHGIPVLVKGQVDTKGLLTTYGSKVFEKNIPAEDAVLVQKLKKAGAVILGKTTMPGQFDSFIHSFRYTMG